MRRPDLPAKNDNAICLRHRVIVFRGQASLLQECPIHCGSEPAREGGDSGHQKIPNKKPRTFSRRAGFSFQQSDA